MRGTPTPHGIGNCWAYALSASSPVTCLAMLPEPTLGSNDCANAGAAMTVAKAGGGVALRRHLSKESAHITQA
jgi:hypothetical protein